MFNLRDYQLKAISEIRDAWKQGYKRPCLVSPCGSGKSVTMSELARRTTHNGGDVFTTVHRLELVEQLTETFKQNDVDMNLCDISMVQTATRHIDKIKPPKLIIIDENHHTTAKSYTKIIDAFPDAYVVGMTATPIRLNGSGLGAVNDKLIIGPTVSELIQWGNLAPFKYYAALSPDTSKLSVRRGEFVIDEVSQLMSQKTIYGNAVKNYLKFGCQKCIVYCASVQNSIETAQAFNESGIIASHVDGKTPDIERARIMESFRNGAIKVLTNYALFSEGIDIPDCDSVILLRPTMSLGLFVQMTMRCMRYMPGKTAIIIDMAENFTRHGLPDTERQWSLDYKKNKEENENKVRTCENCYSVYPNTVTICEPCEWDMRQAWCPKCKEKQQYGKGTCFHCGTELKQGVINERKIDENAEFQEIKSVTFNSPDECNSVKDLYAYAKQKGYKPGWAYIKAKSRGYLK